MDPFNELHKDDKNIEIASWLILNTFDQYESNILIKNVSNDLNNTYGINAIIFISDADISSERIYSKP